MKNINFLIEQVLNNVDFCTEHTEMIEDNDNYICDNFDGFANEDLLLKIVQASSQNENVARFLSAYVIHLSQKEITPCVFNAILSISSKYRKSILIGLSYESIPALISVLKKAKHPSEFDALLKLCTKAIDKKQYILHCGI